MNSKNTKGIYINKGLVLFITLYHKGYSISKKVKIIYQYIPREVSKIVIYYL